MRLHLTTIERYVLGQTLLSVLGAAAIIFSVVLLINYAEMARQIGATVDITFAQTAYLTALNSPATMVVLLPFVFLFGTAAAFIFLNRRSELRWPCERPAYRLGVSSCRRRFQPSWWASSPSPSSIP